MAESKIVNRYDKVAYYGVPGSEGTVVFHRMTKFTEMSTSKNPIEYETQYIDEAYATTTTTGYSSSVSFAFDQYTGNEVHDDLIEIIDKELVGLDAVREIVIVDFTKPVNGASASYQAKKRAFTVVADTDGGNSDRYDYSGTFKPYGETVFGTATVDSAADTLTFTDSETEGE